MAPKGYKVVQKLGEGTYGTVSLIKRKNKRLALKTNKSKESGIPLDMLREYVALRCVDNHFAVVRLVDHSFEDRELVFDYHECSLRQHLKSNGSMGASTSLSVFSQLCEALNYCEQMHIIHRDVSANNVLINTKSNHAVLIDFGACKFVTNDSSRKNTLGVTTIWYCAPEMLLGDVFYSNKIDTWAATLLFAEMKLGKSMFPGDSHYGQLIQIFSVLGTPRGDTWPGVESLPFYSSFPCFENKLLLQFSGQRFRPEEIQILEKGLSLDPSNRSTAKELSTMARATIRQSAFNKPPVRASLEQATKSLISEQNFGWSGEINSTMRSVLVEWIGQVNTSYSMNKNTLDTAIKLIDTYVSENKVTKQDLQGVGIASLMIMSKLLETFCIEVADAVHMCDDAYSAEQIVKIESCVAETAIEVVKEIQSASQ